MFHARILYFFILIAYEASGFVLPDYPTLKICNGPKDPRSVRTYAHVKRYYSDCNHVRNHLIISYITEKDDISFLESIKTVEGALIITVNTRSRISLPNLVIVEGSPHYRIDGMNAAVYIKDNKHPESNGVSILDLRSLRSVSRNDVVIESNLNFCYLNLVNWKELLEDLTKQLVHFMDVTKCPDNLKCSSSCKSHPNNCWGSQEGLCQQFGSCPQKDQCSESRRCLSTGGCCSLKCAGGCSGILASQCVACRYYQNATHCLNECPRRWLTVEGRKVRNPEFKLSFGSLCVKKCPDSFVEFGDSCVVACDEGYFIKDQKCLSCKEANALQEERHACKENCHLSHIVDKVTAKKPSILTNSVLYRDGKPTFTWRSILKELINCTRLQARNGIHIRTPTGAEGSDERVRAEDLNNLQNITELQGGLRLDLKTFPGIQNLSFLSKLSVLKSAEMGLIVSGGANLRFLGLSGMRQLKMAHIEISNNPRLCYQNGNKMLRKDGGVFTGNELVSDCKRENRVCDRNCVAADGCWGPGPTMCIRCKEKQAGEYCVSKCTDIPGYFKNVSSHLCDPCHPQCKSCSGRRPDQCIGRCKNAQDGQTCVEKCPVKKYLNETGHCLHCNDVCKPNKEGRYCTGPSSKPGPGGCNFCNYLEFNEKKELVRCRLFCPSGFYSELFSDDEIIRRYAPKYISTKSRMCNPCHPFCAKCTKYGDQVQCVKCKPQYFKSIGLQPCVHKCDRGFFEDRKIMRCVKCHKECQSSCDGPTDRDCHDCRVFRIYVNGSQTQFQCTSKCPENLRYHTFVQGSSERICLARPLTDKGLVIKVTIGICVGILIVLGIIVFLLIMRRRSQILKEREEVRAKYTRRVEEELVPLSETGTQPNFGKLRIISAKHLTKGNRVGSGQFGTVFRGVWIPEVEEDEKSVKIDVAIKELKSTNSSAATKEFLSEAHVMASVNNKYCVHLLGVCLVSPMKLVSVFIPLGNLTSYMPKHRKEITSRIILTWALQIAKGMSYLEEKGIVHRDLAARNVLLEDINLVRITDFGLAKLVDPNGEGTLVDKGGRLPIQWLAIECLRELLFSHKSDVWAYGVTLWEILTFASKRPYGSMRIKEIVDFLERGERLEQPNNCTLDFYMLLLKCWVNEEDGRPTFEELVAELTGMATDPSHYISTEMDIKLSQNRRQSMSNHKPPVDVGYVDPVAERSADPTNSEAIPLRTMNSYEDPHEEDEEAGPVDTEYLLPDRFEPQETVQTTTLPEADRVIDNHNDDARNQSETEKISFRSSSSSDTNPNHGYMAVSTEV